jgi:integrase
LKPCSTAKVPAGTFHDLRKTAVANWFRQAMSEYDVMAPAGHANFQTTHRFYLAVADDLILRARCAISEEVRPELIEKCRRKHASPAV